MTLISKKLALKLGLKVVDEVIRAAGVTGHALRITGHTNTHLCIGKTEIRHTIRVCEDLPYKILLGNDVFVKLGNIGFNMSRREMTVNGVSIPLGKHEMDARTVATVTIPPGTKIGFEARMESEVDGAYTFEPTLKRHDLFIGRSVDCAKKGLIRVSVINAGNRVITLAPDTQLGVCEAYDDDMCIPPEASPRKLPPPSQRINLDDTDLTEVEKDLVRLLVDEYRDVIADDLSDLPGTSIIKHHIEIQPGVKPIRSKPYPCPVGLKPEVRKQLDEMLKAGVIEPAHGEWTSPIVMVRKRDASWRFCVDFRRLNAVTVKESFPMASVDEAVEKLHGKRYFSLLDLFSGFWQVALDEESRDKSAFITDQGCFRFTRMPMGLQGSPATMQRLALAVNLDLITEGSSLCYVDDYLFCSSSFQAHYGLMKTVFSRFRKVGLRVKLAKCALFQKELVYLGHTVTRDGLGVEPQNVAKMRSFPSPTTPKQCRRLNGLFSYYRKFIPQYAEIVSPIVRLTKQDVAFEWTDECEEAKRQLIELVTSAPILKYPCFTEEFFLTTDASAVAVAGVLSQYEGKLDHPIAFFSRMLNKAEQKYGATELELMAIVMAIRHFSKFLYGCRFTVRTDNIACVSLMQKPNLSPRMARWAMSVQDFQITMRYREAAKNAVADALSRPTDIMAITAEDDQDDEEEEPVVDLPEQENRERVRAAQSTDYYLGPIMMYLERNAFPKDMSRATRNVTRERAEHFRIRGRVLYRSLRGKCLLAIPVSMRRELLMAAHDSVTAMHPGVVKTMLRLQEQYWFPAMRQTVYDYIKACELCQTRKHPTRPVRLPTKNLISERPWDILSIDFVGPLVVTPEKLKNILVFTDHFTRWVECFPTVDQKADTVARIYVEQIICRYGLSKVFLSDRAANFLGHVVTGINRLLKVDQRSTVAFKPSTNGMCEVQNKQIGAMMSYFVDQHHMDWPRYVPFAQLAHNSSRHTVINASPSMLLMGREMRLPHDLTMPSPPDLEIPEGEYVGVMAERFERTWEAARATMAMSQAKQNRRMVPKLVPSDVKVGDAVFYYKKRGYAKLSSKFIRRWTGPYVVTEVTDTNARIRLFDKPDSNTFMVNLAYLKLYIGPTVRSMSDDLVLDLDPVDDIEPPGPDEIPDEEIPEMSARSDDSDDSVNVYSDDGYSAESDGQAGAPTFRPTTRRRIVTDTTDTEPARQSSTRAASPPTIGTRSPSEPAGTVTEPSVRRRPTRVKKTTRRDEFLYTED